MQLYPAIDVQGGSVARADRAADPVAAARALAAAGVAWAHLVDLDRARGAGRDDRTMRDVIAALAGVRVQLGGGLEDPDDVREALGWGVARVVVGSVGRLGSLARSAGAARLGLAIEVGGAASGPVAPEALVDRAVEAGVTTVVYRDKDRDGTLSGADLAGAGRLLGRGADIVLAGGVATLDELRRAREVGFGGVIVGRALLAGRFTLGEALACCG